MVWYLHQRKGWILQHFMFVEFKPLWLLSWLVKGPRMRIEVSFLPGPAIVQSQRNAQSSILILNWLAYYLKLFINSYNLH